MIGKYALHPFCNRKLLIVADDVVDPNFGTGMYEICSITEVNYSRVLIFSKLLFGSFNMRVCI